MAYEFKKLSDVNSLEGMKEGLNVLVEDNGEIVKVAASEIIEQAIENMPSVEADIKEKTLVITHDSANYSANMSFEDFAYLFDEKKLNGIQLFMYDGGYLHIFFCSDVSNYGDVCYMSFNRVNSDDSHYLVFYSDGRVEEG